MPRNQTRASRRTRQGKQTAAAVRDDSAEESSETVAVTTESPTVGRNKRSTRNLSVIYSDSSRRVSGVTAERVTRSRTRASRNETTEPTRAPVDSDDDDSYSESDSSPRKKVRTSRRRSSPRKAAKSSAGNRTSKAGRKRKVGRRSRKQETEDEESEDSLHLSESEGEEMEQDNEEEDEEADNESERVKLDTVATPRRGNRSGTRSSSASTPSTPNVTNKSSPSVVLLRMENTPTNAARPTRGRGAAKQKKDPAAAAKSDDITASEEGESAAHTGSSRVRGRRSVRQSRQQQSSTQQQQQQQQSTARRGKMVPTEENAAVTTDTANKEDGGDKEKEKSEEEQEQQPQEEKETTATTIAVAEEEKSAAAAAAEDEEDGGDDDDEEKKEDRTDEPKDIPEKKDADNEGSTSAVGDPLARADPTPVEKMEVDEPSGSDVVTDDQVSKATDAVEEVKTDSGNAGKHKLELEGDSGLESTLLSKKAKLDEEPVKPEEKDAPKMDVEETTNATAEVEKASNEEDKTAACIKMSEEAVMSEKIAVCDDSAINGEKAAKEPEPPSDNTITAAAAAAPAVVEPKVNGNTTDSTGVNNSDTDNNSSSLGVNISRRWVANPDLSDNAGKDVFSVVSYNLAEEDWSAKHQNLVDEVLQLSPSILCLQEIDEGYFKRLLDSALKSHGYIGLYKAGKLANKGLATFYLLSSFEVLHHRELEVQDLLEKDIHRANLLDEEKEALKAFLNSQAPVLITKLKSISTGKTITVGTVSLPSDNEVVLAVQVAAVMREILEISEGPNNPHVLCSSFDLDEDSVVYQLLRDGLLKNEVVDDLKKKAKVPVLEKESAEISTLLETFFQHSSANLKSSYGSILGHELTFPDKTRKLSKDSVWFSSNSLFTKNVLDVGRVGKQVPPNNHVSLKVELGFMN